MKIFTTEQIRRLDQSTIQNEPIASIDLMERASHKFAKWFMEMFPNREKTIHVFCGPGNNGGDGLAVARLLSQDHFQVNAYLLVISENLSPDCEANLKRLINARNCSQIKLAKDDPVPEIQAGDIVIDAVFGSGLSRPVEGYWSDFIENLNRQLVTRVAIDIPSGMFADAPTNGVSIYADHTFSFEMPKLGFVFPENNKRVGEWAYRSIGLDPSFIDNEDTEYYYTTSKTVKKLLRQRNKFDHKGSYGHALLVVGSYGKIGAAVLAARAVLRSGAGLLTVHVPKCGYDILQSTVPEAMVSTSADDHLITSLDFDLAKYSSVGIGCGLSVNALTKNALGGLMEQVSASLVLDADALNLISANPDLLKKVPKNSILTPHPKEFERLFGKTSNNFERNRLQCEKAGELGVYIVLKGANSAIACPDGTCHFNSTGNPGMATGGSGDVLTGIITGLLAQSYTSFEAAIIGVYLHGLAGDLAAAEIGMEALIAGDISNYLGRAFKSLTTSLS